MQPNGLNLHEYSAKGSSVTGVTLRWALFGLQWHTCSSVYGSPERFLEHWIKSAHLWIEHLRAPAVWTPLHPALLLYSTLKPTIINKLQLSHPGQNKSVHKSTQVQASITMAHTTTGRSQCLFICLLWGWVHSTLGGIYWHMLILMLFMFYCTFPPRSSLGNHRH